ncbi:MAG: hypothetical protein H7123_09410, partial [Thermoleophilia bacterium]|nr:hypothetical protein [Thermoleophilia bacterium]
PRGLPQNDQDAAIWDWKLDKTDPAQPLALGEPEDTSGLIANPMLSNSLETPKNPPGFIVWPGLRDGVHPGGMPGDTYVGDRPQILFNPVDGKPAFPLFRPHIGQRAPFTPAHSGTPFLGPRVNATGTSVVDPYSNQPDGLCAKAAPTRQFDITSIETPIKTTSRGDVDPTGMIFALDKDKAGIRAGTKPALPLAIRANIGDCVQVNFATEMTDANAFNGFAKNNMHIHHVQFDIQGSDGASAGMVFDQSIRPYKVVDSQLVGAAHRGDRVLKLTSAAKFQPGEWIGIGIGQEGITVRQITAVAGTVVTLSEGLDSVRPSGTWVGTEFQKYQWFPDVALDNVFWHDHVDGIHGWGKGLVGMLNIEPRGSTYHDPASGNQVDSGQIVDIHTNSALAPGLVDGSYRELALWQIDDNPTTDSTLNLRAEPWADRLLKDPDRSLLFSSFIHGDPFTPLPRAYVGDPFVIRTINVSGTAVDTLHVDGHAETPEFRFKDSTGSRIGQTTDTIHFGISERFTEILNGGAGGEQHAAGDYLYMNGVGRRFQQGAWGLLRVLGAKASTLKPLPGRPVPPSGPGVPRVTAQRPPAAASAGPPCPTNAPTKVFDITAVDVPGKGGRRPGVRATFSPTVFAAAVQRGARAPEPLVLHVAMGDCLNVTLHNSRQARASFHVSELERTVESSGINVGYNPEQTVVPGGVRTYRLYAASERSGGALIQDFGDMGNLNAAGTYGMVVVSPRGATFRDPTSGLPKDIGYGVDVIEDNGRGYRDYSLILADTDDKIGANSTPYRTVVQGVSTINYATVTGSGNPSTQFETTGESAPGTPILAAYAGDPMRVHIAVAPGSEQSHGFGMGGLSWHRDPYIPDSEEATVIGLGAWETFDLHMIGGAGGRALTRGDYIYEDTRRPFTDAGIWGMYRVLGGGACTSLLALPGRDCSGDPAP